MNKVILIGHITREIESRVLTTGNAVCNFTLAVNRNFRKSTGEKAQESLFIEIRAYNKLAEVMNQYLHKGSKVLIEGRLHLEQWQDQMGAKKQKHVIMAENMQMLDSKDSQDKTGYQESNEYAHTNEYAHAYTHTHEQAQDNQEVAMQLKNPAQIISLNSDLDFFNVTKDDVNKIATINFRGTQIVSDDIKTRWEKIVKQLFEKYNLQNYKIEVKKEIIPDIPNNPNFQNEIRNDEIPF